jgi:hypothetical protein
VRARGNQLTGNVLGLDVRAAGRLRLATASGPAC